MGTSRDDRSRSPQTEHKDIATELRRCGSMAELRTLVEAQTDLSLQLRSPRVQGELAQLATRVPDAEDAIRTLLFAVRRTGGALRELDPIVAQFTRDIALDESVEPASFGEASRAAVSGPALETGRCLDYLKTRTTWDQRWETPVVLGLIEDIAVERAFDALPILADALEDAGCTDNALLERLRAENSVAFRISLHAWLARERGEDGLSALRTGVREVLTEPDPEAQNAEHLRFSLPKGVSEHACIAALRRVLIDACFELPVEHERWALERFVTNPPAYSSPLELYEGIPNRPSSLQAISPSPYAMIRYFSIATDPLSRQYLVEWLCRNDRRAEYATQALDHLRPDEKEERRSLFDIILQRDYLGGFNALRALRRSPDEETKHRLIEAIIARDRRGASAAPALEYATDPDQRTRLVATVVENDREAQCATEALGHLRPDEKEERRSLFDIILQRDYLGGFNAMQAIRCSPDEEMKHRLIEAIIVRGSGGSASAALEYSTDPDQRRQLVDSLVRSTDFLHRLDINHALLHVHEPELRDALSRALSE